MDDIHFHLIINHFPIIGTIFTVLILIIGIFARSELLKRTAYSLFILMAFLTFLSNKSGENAEGHAKKVDGINETMIEEHEEMADFSFWTAIITAALSLLALFFSIKENDMKGVFSVLVLAVASVSIYFLWQTGQTGGKIRHTETYESQIL